MHQPSGFGGDWPASAVHHRGWPPASEPFLSDWPRGRHTPGNGLAQAAPAGLAWGESSGDLHKNLKEPLAKWGGGGGDGNARPAPPGSGRPRGEVPRPGPALAVRPSPGVGRGGPVPAAPPAPASSYGADGSAPRPRRAGRHRGERVQARVALTGAPGRPVPRRSYLTGTARSAGDSSEEPQGVTAAPPSSISPRSDGSRPAPRRRRRRRRLREIPGEPARAAVSECSGLLCLPAFIHSASFCVICKNYYFLAAVTLRFKLTGECMEQCEEEYLPIQKTLGKHPHLTVIHHRQLLRAVSVETLIRFMHPFLLRSVLMLK